METLQQEGFEIVDQYLFLDMSHGDIEEACIGSSCEVDV